jgi:hypothetical protein
MSPSAEEAGVLRGARGLTCAHRSHHNLGLLRRTLEPTQESDFVYVACVSVYFLEYYQHCR